MSFPPLQVDDDPLNSDDDLDDVGSDKSDEGFETQDVVICQWEKVLSHCSVLLLLAEALNHLLSACEFWVGLISRLSEFGYNYMFLVATKL